MGTIQEVVVMKSKASKLAEALEKAATDLRIAVDRGDDYWTDFCSVGWYHRELNEKLDELDKERQCNTISR